MISMHDDIGLTAEMRGTATGALVRAQLDRPDLPGLSISFYLVGDVIDVTSYEEERWTQGLTHPVYNVTYCPDAVRPPVDLIRGVSFDAALDCLRRIDDFAPLRRDPVRDQALSGDVP